MPFRVFQIKMISVGRDKYAAANADIIRNTGASEPLPAYRANLNLAIQHSSSESSIYPARISSTRDNTRKRSARTSGALNFILLREQGCPPPPADTPSYSSRGRDMWHSLRAETRRAHRRKFPRLCV